MPFSERTGNHLISFLYPIISNYPYYLAAVLVRLKPNIWSFSNCLWRSWDQTSTRWASPSPSVEGVDLLTRFRENCIFLNVNEDTAPSLFIPKGDEAIEAYAQRSQQRTYNFSPIWWHHSQIVLRGNFLFENDVNRQLVSLCLPTTTERCSAESSGKSRGPWRPRGAGPKCWGMHVNLDVISFSQLTLLHWCT